MATLFVNAIQYFSINPVGIDIYILITFIFIVTKLRPYQSYLYPYS